MYLVLCLVLLVAVAFAAFAVGTRTTVNTGGYCEVETHWFFGWYVRCKGGERCAASQRCVLQSRKKGSEENWGDTGINPGASAKWNEEMEYRCSCR